MLGEFQNKCQLWTCNICMEERMNWSKQKKVNINLDLCMKNETFMTMCNGYKESFQIMRCIWMNANK